MAGSVSDRETLEKIKKCICLQCYCYRGGVVAKQHFFDKFQKFYSMDKLTIFLKVLFFKFWRWFHRKNCRGCESPVIDFKECPSCSCSK